VCVRVNFQTLISPLLKQLSTSGKLAFPAIFKLYTMPSSDFTLNITFHIAIKSGEFELVVVVVSVSTVLHERGHDHSYPVVFAEFKSMH